MGGEGDSYLCQGYLSESECNSVTGVQICVLRFCSSPLPQGDIPQDIMVTLDASDAGNDAVILHIVKGK